MRPSGAAARRFLSLPLPMTAPGFIGNLILEVKRQHQRSKLAFRGFTSRAGNDCPILLADLQPSWSASPFAPGACGEPSFLLPVCTPGRRSY